MDVWAASCKSRVSKDSSSEASIFGKHDHEAQLFQCHFIILPAVGANGAYHHEIDDSNFNQGKNPVRADHDLWLVFTVVPVAACKAEHAWTRVGKIFIKAFIHDRLGLLDGFLVRFGKFICSFLSKFLCFVSLARSLALNFCLFVL
jgi:hypothetical protein